MVSGCVIVIMIIMIMNFLFKVGWPNRWRLINANLDGVAEWLRHSVSNHARSTRVGSNPVVGSTSHKPTVNSTAHPSEVGK